MGLGGKNEMREVGRYALHGIIASGGMATVHFGRMVGAVGFSRTVAIKRLHAHFASDPEFVSMFLDEARLAARIRHPNVIPTLDVVATSGELFLVMEYVPGETLARLSKQVREGGRQIPHRIVAGIVSGVLHGLHAAHEAKDERGAALSIVHRDVSPQNVHVGTDGVARVLDFGVAKAAGRIQTTREGQIKGKLAYMAPEQLRGAEIDRSCDIYAVGVMLWELITGQRLFFGDNEGVVVARVLEGKIPAPSTVVQQGARTALSERTLTQLQRLDSCILRAVNSDPSKRFATARDMALELEACVQPSTSSQIGDWVEHNATEILAERAAKVAEIESQLVPDSLERPSDVQKLLRGDSNSNVHNKTLQIGEGQPGLVHTDASRTALLTQPSSPVTQPSTISVSSNLQDLQGLPFEDKPKRSRGLIVGSVFAVLLASIISLFVIAKITNKPDVPTPGSGTVDPSVAPDAVAKAAEQARVDAERAAEEERATAAAKAHAEEERKAKEAKEAKEAADKLRAEQNARNSGRNGGGHTGAGVGGTGKTGGTGTGTAKPPSTATTAAPCPLVSSIENGITVYKRVCP
jgi:serine/threonine protein kinase